MGVFKEKLEKINKSKNAKLNLNLKCEQKNGNYEGSLRWCVFCII